MALEKPVFIVGSGRNGSSVIYETLARHKDFGWFTNYSGMRPRYAFVDIFVRWENLPLLGRVIRGEKRQYKQGQEFLSQLKLRPDEPWGLARRCFEVDFNRSYLVDTHAAETEKERFQKAASRALRLQGKRRFLGKITGPTRMTFLRSIFPDAVFLHIVRDGRAVVNSLLNVGFWKRGGSYERPRWSGGLPENWEEEWDRYGRSPMALAAMQWRTIMDIAEQERSQLGPDQFLLVRYEDYVSEPATHLGEILELCEMEPDPNLVSSLDLSSRFVDMNAKFREAFSEDEICQLNTIMGEWLQRFGYLEQPASSP